MAARCQPDLDRVDAHVVLQRVRTILWGELTHQQANRALADFLEVPTRTVRRWLNGERAIHEGVWNDMNKLLDQRAGVALQRGDRTRVREIRQLQDWISGLLS